MINTLDIIVEPQLLAKPKPVPWPRLPRVTHPQKNRVVGRIGIEWPHPGPIVVTPDGSRAYIGMRIGPKHGIVVIDTVANKAVGAITLSRAYYKLTRRDLAVKDLAISPDGSRIYALTKHGIIGIDPQNDKVVDRIRIGGRAMAITPDGSRLIISGAGPEIPGSGAGVVGVLDLQTNVKIAVIPVGRNPGAIAIRPDGPRAYVINARDNSMSVIDLGTYQEISKISIRSLGGGRIAITPDSSRAYISTARSNRIIVVNLNNNQRIAVVRLSGYARYGARSIVISPDGLRVFLRSGQVIDTTTNQVIGVIHSYRGGPGMAFSSDGSRMYSALRDEVIVVE
ncbi:MAG: YncE family protein [Nitrososphaerales archaeon]|nr:YncE family protein [Deltaproteobacteria bacterium]